MSAKIRNIASVVNISLLKKTWQFLFKSNKLHEFPNLLQICVRGQKEVLTNILMATKKIIIKRKNHHSWKQEALHKQRHERDFRWNLLTIFWGVFFLLLIFKHNTTSRVWEGNGSTMLMGLKNPINNNYWCLFFFQVFFLPLLLPLLHFYTSGTAKYIFFSCYFDNS